MWQRKIKTLFKLCIKNNVPQQDWNKQTSIIKVIPPSQQHVDSHIKSSEMFLR